MSDSGGDRAQQLIAQGNKLFSRRTSLESLWQEVAENFYPERADFTVCRTLGEDFAADLYSSYPLIVRRELGNSFSSMLRRKDQEWFKISVDRDDQLDQAGREWLEWASGVQRRAMYDPMANFVRATKEGDHDFAAFGQCVISEEVHWENVALIYRTWHLRDVAWREREDGSICDRHHKFKETAYNLKRRFGEDKLHPRMNECFTSGRDPFQEFNCRRIILPAKDYELRDGKPNRFPWVSVFLDVDNNHMIDDTPSRSAVYQIPRWQTVSGSQYSYSPAVVAGLPDARLLQAISLTLLEAGEMAVRPPLIAVNDAIQGGTQLYAGGITNVDAAYDERLGEVLRPIYQDKTGLPFGIEIAQAKEEALRRAFFIDKLRMLPPKEMTAYEASKWTQDWIREAIPLFEPMEDEYNARLCMQTFDDLLAVGAFGPPQDIPESLQGAKVSFKFDSPLSQAIERQKGQKLGEARQLIDLAMPLDQSAAAMIDVRVALREALNGIGVPAKWLRTERAVDAHAKELAAQQEQQQQVADLQAGADAGKTAGEAAQAIQAAA
jgi:hypothetical protein